MLHPARLLWTLFACACFLPIAMAQAQVLKTWNFDETGTTQKWLVPPTMRGSVQSGTLWLTLSDLNPDKDRR
jgi:hypothetical protein